MAKRSAPHQKAPKASKRQRFEEAAVPTGSEREIRTAQDLKQLVVFDQSYVPVLRSNLVQIEDFVRGLRDATADTTGRVILLEFLNSSKEDDPASISLAPVFQTWSFAVETNHDGLLRTIPALLATILEAISGWIEFRTAGSQLCRALLLEEQRKCMERCLAPERQKAGVLIGTLRLLTQIVAYDGGSHAAAVSRQRDVYRHLEKLLTSTARDTDSPRRDEKHFSVRYSAVAFLLANLRHQSMFAKTDLLLKTPLASKLFHHLDSDPPDLIRDILNQSQDQILKDYSLPLAAKQSFFNEPVLLQAIRLLRLDQSGSAYEPIAQLAHELLLAVCLSSDEGVARAAESELETTLGVVGEDATAHDEPFAPGLRRSVAGVDLVRPRTLSTLLEKLRPNGSLTERSLALAIFGKHPAQVVEYFTRVKALFDPKLTAYWVGYSSFLLSIVTLPLTNDTIEKSMTKREEHAQTATLKASILPPPLTHDALEKCFTKGPPLVTLFATRILLAAFTKLETYVASLKASDSNIRDSTRPTLEWFSEHCPTVKAVLVAYSTNEKSELLREQLSKLLSKYCALIPKLVMDAQGSMAGFLTKGLESIQASASSTDQNELSQMHVYNLLRIASSSPGISWGVKMAKGVSYSPFTSVLRTCVFREKDSKLALDLLMPVLRNQSILQTKHPERALAGLLESLREEKTAADSDKVFAFFDSCIAKLFNFDLKYISMLYELIDKLDLRRDREVESFSLLTVAIGDQWQHVVSSKDKAEINHLARWIGRYIEAMDDAGESRTILRSIRDQMVAQTEDVEARAAIKKTLAEGKKLSILPKSIDEGPTRMNGISASRTSAGANKLTKEAMRKELDNALRPPSEPENYPALTRWKRKDASDIVDDGTIADLAACLSSTSLDIRRQGLSALRSLVPKIQASDLGCKTQLYLLLSELVETASSLISDSPLPSLATSLVRMALPILQDPLHALYPKVNDFLLQRPEWVVSRLPSYWLRSIFLTPPSMPGGYTREVAWLLSLLHAGLRTAADAELYRSNGVVEQILSRCGGAGEGVGEALDDAALRLIYRWTFFPEGADMLVTRAGILAWIENGLAGCTSTPTSIREAKETKRTEEQEKEKRRLTLLCLLDRIAETSDAEKLARWSLSKDGVAGHITRLKRMYDR